MKILYILKHNPWGIGGGCYACRNYLELFSELFLQDNIDVLICSEYLQNQIDANLKNCKFIPVPPRSKFSQSLSPITHILHRHQKTATKILQRNYYDYCIFDHNSIAGSLVDLCKQKGIKTIVLNHNCELEYFKDNNGKLKNILLLSSVQKNEKNAYLKCDYNIFLTEEDNEIFKRLYGTSQTTTIIGGCFLRKEEKISETDSPFNDKLKIVISGTMGNVQNKDGILYFLNELYQYIPKDMEIILTGRNPSEEIINICKLHNNIQLIANPKNILDIVEKCDIFVCPTKLGGGMKLRLIDGLRCGLPVISHKVSARGYSFFEKEGVVMSFESPEEFKNHVDSLIQKIKTGRINRRYIKQQVKKHLGFQSALERIKIVKK